MPPPQGLWPGWAVVALACGLDWLVGDPPRWPHPVVLMGGLIQALRRRAEAWAGFDSRRLQLAGGGITLVLLGTGAGGGWLLERLAQAGWRWGAVAGVIASLPLLLGLASALAGRSLEQAVRAVLEALPPDGGDGQGEGLESARRQLARIVGRDTHDLDRAGMLRAAAETASENAVDGLFTPLFWMLVGAALWPLGPSWAPGPLALAWTFKAASTLDSMLGYRRGRLRRLGSAGARCDDALVWLPCRLVALSLPLLAPPWQLWPPLHRLRRALAEGAADPSPNAGLSQAIYAQVARIRLGGLNRYGTLERLKPVLGKEFESPDGAAVIQILRLNRQLEGLWLIASATSFAAIGAVLTGPQ